MLRVIGRVVKWFIFGVAGIIVLVIFAIIFSEEDVQFSAEPVEPDWAAIAAWPGIDAEDVDARPDPGRAYTAIILDDSGSMGSDIVPAREAVIASLDAMGTEDRVAVIALNAGVILPFTRVYDAQATLPALLEPVISEGGTPLTGALAAARTGLAQEAAVAGGFGTYRILVTTDGAADDAMALQAEVEEIARVTPIQIATIGVGISGNHILRRNDLAAFVGIDDVAQLAAALRDAIAEEQTFSAITSFGDG
ncbi:MAG: vWA domain-containing protein [Pseudomonadota bacterium]